MVNYAENEYFKQQMAGGKPGPRAGGPRLPKMPVLQDFQFYNAARLTEIYEKDAAYELHKHIMAQKEAAARQQVKNLMSLTKYSCPACLEFA